jgi:hypothetical protein
VNANKITSKLWDKELKAIIASMLFLALGWAILWETHYAMKIDIEKVSTVFVALLLIPLASYLVISGRLEELKGPGGWELKFAKLAATEIDQETIDACIDNTDIIRKGPVSDLGLITLRLRDLPVSKPIILTVNLGSDEYKENYIRKDSLKYIRGLSQFRNFKLVVFLRDNKYEANMTPKSIERLLMDEESGEEFIRVINNGQLEKFFNYLDIVRDYITRRTTY